MLPLATDRAVAQPEPRRDVISVGGDASYPPYEYVSEDGEPSGFHVDLARAIGEVLQVEVVFELGPWPDVFDRHSRGEIDLILLLRTPERESSYLFTEPIRNLPYTIFRRTNGPTAQTMAQLRHRRVAVQDRTAASSRLAAEASVELILVPTEQEAVQLLAADEVDFAVVSDVYRVAQFRDQGLEELIEAGDPLFSYPYCFSTPAGGEALITRVDNAIAILRQTGAYGEIERKWFEPPPTWVERHVIGNAAWLVPAGLAGVSLGIIWTLTLRRRVRTATRELERELEARAAAEAEMRTLVDRLELAIEGGEGAVWYMQIPAEQPAGTFPDEIYLDPRAKAFAGYADDELASSVNAWMSLVLPEDVDLVHTAMRTRLAGQQLVEPVEYRIRHRDGTIRWIHSRGRMMRRGDGSPLQYSGILWDITERRRGDEAMAASEAFHRAMLVNAFDGKLIVDRGGVIRFASNSAERILGFEPGELVGTFFADLAAAEDGGKADALLDRCTGGPAESLLDEFRLVRKDGAERLNEFRTVDLLENPSVSGILISFRDVTETRRYEETFRRLIQSTAAVGEDHFAALAESLAEALRVRCVFIAEVTPGSGRARVIQGWRDGGPMPETSFDLEASVMGGVLTAETHCVRLNCGETHPDDPMVRAVNARSCIAVPLRDGGGLTIGFIAALHDAPIDAMRRPLDMLRILAARAAAELERRQAERALRDTRSLLATALDQLPNVVLYQTGGGREFLSENVENLIGIPARDISADRGRFLARIDPEELTRIRGIVLEWEGSGCPGVLTFSFTARHMDGRELVLEDRRVGLDLPDGRREITGVLLDITEQARTRAESERTARRESLLAGLGQVALTESDLGRVIAAAVDAVREGLPSGTARVLMGEGSWSEVDALGSEAGSAGDGASGPALRVPIRAERGTYGFLEAGDSGRPRSESDVDFMRSIAATISAMLARRTAQETLAANERRYRLLFEDHPHPMWIYDTETLRIIKVNDAAVRHYGYPRERFEQLTLLDLRPAGHHEEVRSAVGRARGRNLSESGIWTHCRADGSQIDAEIISSPAPFVAANARLVVAIDRTRQQRALADLRETTSFLESLLEFSPLLTVVIDRAGVIRTANSAALRWLGGTPAGVVGRPPGAFLPTDAAVTIEDIIGRARSTAKPCTGQMTFATGRDEPRTYLVTAFPVLSGEGGLDVALVAADITEERQAREQLRESETRYRQIFETAQEGIWLVNAQWRTEMVNQRLTRIIGRPADEIIGRHIMELFPAEAHGEVRKLMDRREAGISEAHEAEIRRPDGTSAWVMINTNPVLDSEGRFAGSLAMVTDISPRRTMELELLEWRQRYALAASTARQILYDWDTAGDSIVWDGATRMILGIEPSEMGDIHDWAERIHPEDRERVDRVIEHAKQHRTAFSVEYRFRHAAGHYIHVEDDGDFVRIGDNPTSHMIGFMADMTERVRDKAELARRAEELARSNADLEKFASIASHDLQEPLRMIASYTRLLANRYKGRLDPQADEFIGYTIEGAQRMQRLIDDLLAYARAAGERPPVTAYPARLPVDRALQNLRKLIGDTGAVIEVDELPLIRTGESQLATVLQNLIGNAIKFRGEQSPRIRVSAVRDGDYWRFSVSDNGIGIDPAQSPRLFNMFTRLHPRTAYEGSGIGLALCKRIVEREGGKIWLESEVGRGTTVHFTLPGADVAANEVDPAAAAAR